MKKMGRPTDNPKNKTIKFRISENLFEEFDIYCKLNNTSKTKLLTDYILKLIENKFE